MGHPPAYVIGERQRDLINIHSEENIRQRWRLKWCGHKPRNDLEEEKFFPRSPREETIWSWWHLAACISDVLSDQICNHLLLQPQATRTDFTVRENIWSQHLICPGSLQRLILLLGLCQVFRYKTLELQKSAPRQASTVEEMPGHTTRI